jgi:hypothetical protein
MYLFFVREFNDIDHITPIVWKMSKDNYPVAIYCLNPEYDIQSDYRLSFLRDLGLKVDFIYNDFDHELGLLHRVMCFAMLWSFDIERRLGTDVRLRSLFFSGMLRQYLRKMGNRLYSMAKRKFYDIHWARNILEQSAAQALCFDWMRPKQYIVEVLLTVARDMSIPTLALPHGVFVYTNDCITIESRPLEIYDKLNSYDYVIVQNVLYKELMAKSGLNRKKIFVLGSARYCNEWMAQNKKILPKMLESNDGNETKLKIVFMTTKARYRVNVERMFKTFELLAKLSGIEVLVKPHTRTKKEAHLYENLSLTNVPDVSSVELCVWADVVLVIGSSIIVEVLAQGKPALYLKYLHENTTIYEEFGACWTIHDEAELMDALLSLQLRKRDVPYTDKNVNSFLSKIIYGGQHGGDVLTGYEQFSVNCAVG